MSKIYRRQVWGLLLCGLYLPAFAQEPLQQQSKGFWYLQTSLYTRHYSADPDHNNTQELLGLERNEDSGLLFGASTFKNSFSQRSFYLYAGKRFDNPTYPVYLKLSGGLIQGYHGDYKDKIPLNRFGVAPAIIPSLGAHFGSVATELVLLGTSAAMITAGVRL
ncbi:MULTISPECIES: sn-glycerol-3-phosphate transporter [unclassified Pseudomonas]|uniref:sn-glycerol-3-phosphate transporter n=1 Tax=unclassified Pseudomonas TaxID=196821 RepID=UPI001032A7CF|nr:MULTISPECIES: sn-glycerol-3-phosphate transporter [unclassified Pseudomonas]